MATVRYEQRSKKSITMIIDHGIDPITKKRKKDTYTIETTDKEVAEQEKLKIELALLEKEYKPSDQSTVEEYFDYWFTTPAAKNLEPKTRVHYKGMCNARIKPWMGKKKIVKLTRKDLENFYNKIIEVGQLSNLDPKNADKPKKPVSKTLVERYHSFIRRVLNHALIEDEIIKKNVAIKMKLPEPEQPADYDPDEDIVKVFTLDEIIKLENEASSTPFSNLVSVALRTGMRREELLALTWDCIDDKEGTIFIKKALSWTSETGYRTRPTKNKQKRIIEATPEVLSFFDRQQKEQAAHKLRLGEHYRKDLNLVFCKEDGHYLSLDTPTRWFPNFCEKIGITRLTFHCLRHTHASHLLSSGEDLEYVSKRLGHSSILITYSTYFHFIPHEKRKALKEFEKRFKK